MELIDRKQTFLKCNKQFLDPALQENEDISKRELWTQTSLYKKMDFK